MINQKAKCMNTRVLGVGAISRRTKGEVNQLLVEVSISSDRLYEKEYSKRKADTFYVNTHGSRR